MHASHPLALALLVASATAMAQPNPTRAITSHPFMGTWTLNQAGKCKSELIVRPNGTTRSTSGAEVTESIYIITPKPSAKGFYKVTDTITKANGKGACGAEPATTGQSATVFVRLDAKGDAMTVCADESATACLGPYQRVQGKGK